MGGLFGKSQTINNVETQIAGFQINTATYGLTVPLVLGTSRISGNIIDWFDFTPIPHTESQETGGKGGGRTTVTTTTWTYTVAVLIGLAEGPGAVGRVWRDKDILSNLAATGFTLFSGENGQAPWSYTQSTHPEKALPYSGLAYVAGVIDLGNRGSLPTFGFEYLGQLRETGDGIDVNPADALQYIVNDLNAGDIDMDGLIRFRTFCKAADILISLPLTETRKAYEIIKDICKATNTLGFWSQDRLKLVPRCDEYLQRGTAIYEPVTTPEYDLTEDDFLENGDSLVIFEREDNSEAYNHVIVEFLNRANSYEVETAEYKIQSDINKRGLRSMPTVEMHYIHTKERAEYVACMLAMDSLYGRNRYKFRLGWSHCLLEPGDFVTIQDDCIGPNKIPVTIVSNEEDEDGQLEIVAKGRPPGIYSPARYTAHQADRPSLDFNSDPGPVNTPIIFELPYVLTDGKMSVEIAVAGKSPMWGGCGVWVSFDGATYRRVGEVRSPSRYGVLAEPLKVGGSTDTINSLNVDMSRSRQKLLGGTRNDAQTYQTLSWVDGELIAYEKAELVSNNRYNLSYLIRGCYGTDIKAHNTNSGFVRLDRDIIFGYEYLPPDIGRTVFIKLTSVNVFGIREQSLEDVEPYIYVIKSKLPDSGVEFTVTQNETKLIAALKSNFTNTDYLEFFTYELRMGPTWEKGVLISRFSGGKYVFDAPNEGTLTFWLKIVDQSGNYSKMATRAIVNVVNLPVKNVIFERQENPDLWTVKNMWRDAAGRYQIRGLLTLGEYAHFADIFGHALYLRSDAEILFPVIDLGPNILDEACFYVDVNGNVQMRYIERLGDFAHFADIFGATLTPMKPQFAKETFVGVNVKYTTRGNARVDIEYRVSIDGQQWSNWMPEAIKQFSGRYVQIRLVPVSVDGVGQVYITGATIQIDVPDVEEIIENIAISAQRTRLTFKRKFAEVKSVAPYTQDLTGKQATCYIVEQTNAYFDLEILDENGGIIAGKLQRATIRGY